MPSVENSWIYFGGLYRSLFGVYSREAVLTETDRGLVQPTTHVSTKRDKTPNQMQMYFSQNKPCLIESFVSVPLFPLSPTESSRSIDLLQDFKDHVFGSLKEQHRKFFNDLLTMLEGLLTDEEKRNLNALMGSKRSYLVQNNLGNQFTISGLDKLWGNEWVNDEFLDTAFSFASKRTNSKVFSIPSTFLLRQLNKYGKPPHLPALEDLKMITAPFVFRQKPDHWGLIGIDLQQQTCFYGENLNSENYILDQKTFNLFIHVVLQYFPSTLFHSFSFQRVVKREFPQQTDSWSCGIQISLVNQSYALNEKPPFQFSQAQILHYKFDFIKNLIHEMMKFNPQIC